MAQYKHKLARTLTPEQRAAMSDKIKADEDYRHALKRDDAPLGSLSPTGEAGSLSVDTGNLDARINKMKQVLRDGTPEKFTGKDRESAEAEYKELGHWLNEKMLTHKEMDLLPKHGYEYQRAVRKSVKQEVGSQEYIQKSSRWRELGARLDPENPEATSIESLRRLQ